MKLSTRPKEDPELNLISLVDIFLLLLVFFMISTTFLDEARIKIRLPEASAERNAMTQPNAIEVTVTAEGGYRVNGQTLINSGTATLTTAILKVAGDSRDAPITIRADARATHQAVVTAMDVVGRMGFRAINIATVNNQTAK
ncbi:MAG: biopolymer transporter ExbD [Candidatus Obscuribacterales bacterium]|nr:biopolymer transporter ExbD [Steroidobacteraceae bacterium]